METIKTASELYREIKKRGLELRQENGRDDVLFTKLSEKLECPNNKLQHCLDNSDLSAEDFLKIFLEIAEPFSLMFKEIWDYLSLNLAPNSLESISIEFGFENNKTEINLDTFRKYVKKIQKIFSKDKYWSYDTFSSLFEISSKIIHNPRNFHPLYENNRYKPGKPFKLPIPRYTDHLFDKVVKKIHYLFERIIDDNVKLYDKEKKLIKLNDNLNLIDEDDELLKRLGYLLTDLLPTWFKIFLNLHKFSQYEKDLAYSIYKQKIEPKIIEEDQENYIEVFEILNILELPFWKNRWHTYEIWATVLLLKILKDFKPKLNIKKGRLPIDGYSRELIATLKAKKFETACIGARIQTKYISGNRKAINPDIRICFSENTDISQETACIVEFKQRKKIDSSHVLEVATSYLNASPNSGGVIIINYDKKTINKKLPEKTYYFDDVTPLNKEKQELLKNTLLDNILKNVEFEPIDDVNRIVLLDVSGSMEQQYNKDIIQLLYQLSEKDIKILKFNNGLIDDTNMVIQTYGGTNLGLALTEIEKKYGLADKMLVVTDGGHDNPKELISKIKSYKECLPNEIEKYYGFITE